MAQALHVELQGDERTIGGVNGARERAMAGSPSDKPGISITRIMQWGLQLLLALAVVTALWQ